jgi:hypothetical protein
MAESRVEYSKYVVYVLQEENTKTLELSSEPEGWEDDDLEIVRNKKSHGILTQFTGGLKFRGDAKDFINSSFSTYGLNANLYLIKYVLKKGQSYIVGDEITPLKFVQRYRGLADFNTKKISNGALEINFNSQELDKLIESFQDDEFLLDRREDLNNSKTGAMPKNNVLIEEGRVLEASGWAIAEMAIDQGERVFSNTTNDITIPTSFGVKGFGRHVEVTEPDFADFGGSINYQPNFFYDDLPDAVKTESRLEINAKWKVKFNCYSDFGTAPTVRPSLQIWKFTGSGYDRLTSLPLGGFVPLGEWMEFDGVVGVFDFGISNEWAMSINFEFWGVISNNGPNAGYFNWQYEVATKNDGDLDYRVDVRQATKYKTLGKKHRFSFVNDVGSRLMQIITGERNKFYSKVFGRRAIDPSTGIALPPQYQDYTFAQDGDWGNIGLISGFDIRDFSLDNELYKSMTISLKDFLESLKATFNVGIGIENSKYGQRLRVEPLNYFYQPTRVVKLPNQVVNISRDTDAAMFYSSLSFGQNQGGDYENGLGLDEPNVSASYVTPLKKTPNEYNKITKIRSDDTGFELMRRQPESLDDTEDRAADLHNWFLDLKIQDGGFYKQLEWEDVLDKIPEGIRNPDSYKSWRFTPKRSMLRHGWVIRAGLEQRINLNKSISLSSSDSNANLSTKYIEGIYEQESNYEIKEDDNTQINTINRSVLLPEIITFTHDVDDGLMDWLEGTTDIIVGGELESVPNWYFRIEFINEDGESETGYLISLKPRKGEFKLYKANTNFY